MTQRRIGTLAHWNEERGFGFIAPESGGENLFVHITAFPRGQKPDLGERLSFEIEIAPDGRKRATRVNLPNRLQLAPIARERSPHESHRTDAHLHHAVPSPPRPTHSRRRPHPFPLVRVVMLIVMAIAGAIGAKEYRERAAPAPLTQAPPTMARPATAPLIATTPHFQCDGRIHCSQMRSCEEATFFLKNCPGTRMDGDGDGIPCEDQWCKSW